MEHDQALSGRLKFTVRRHKLNKECLFSPGAQGAGRRGAVGVGPHEDDAQPVELPRRDARRCRRACRACTQV